MQTDQHDAAEQGQDRPAAGQDEASTSTTADDGLNPGDVTCGFTITSREPLDEIDGEAIVGRHEKSGARLLYLKNDDDNKAFSISFKTPPADDTGVFHILEHSVLCGSDKFPVKEPFVNLLKTSMQTFLNALTFPDKTMYPVASTNEQDLLNLIDVYMDAVLHPRIYDTKAIFEQEGWHYELDEPSDGATEGAVAEGDAAMAAGAEDAAAAEGAAQGAGVEGASSEGPAGEGAGVAAKAGQPTLRYNGVVFNEMKGALSDVDSVLYQQMSKALFPDTCYAYESGGHPRSIPTLTYEGYLDTHARHYRLDNSYIVLYGNMDPSRVLGFLDERYLSAADCAPRTGAAPNEIGHQKPLVSLSNVVEMDTTPDNETVGIGYVIGDAHDFERVLACDVLLDALMGGNESPIKRTLLDADLGGDVTAYLMDSQAQPAAMFQLKNAKPGSAPIFYDVVEREAARLVEDGIDRSLLEASLAQMAFMLRERDRGMADGVPLAMSALAGWLYDDDDPTLYLRYEEPLAHMRAGLDDGYFEKLLKSLIIDNDHKALVSVVPHPAGQGATAEETELAEHLQTMDEADRQQVRDEVAELRRAQQTPDSPEALATLPQLHVDDIGPAKPDPAFDVLEPGQGVPYRCLFHNLPTRNIDYVTLYFDANNLVWENVPYATLFTLFAGQLDAGDLSAADLDVLLRSHLGTFRMGVSPVYAVDDPDRVSLRLSVAASAISEEVEKLATLPQLVWERTRFDETTKSKMRDILVQKRIMMEQSFINSGHLAAAGRLSSYLFKESLVYEQIIGVDFYLFLKDLIDHFDERFDDLVARLDTIRRKVFTSDNLTVSFTGSREDFDAYWKAAGTLGLSETESPSQHLVIPQPSVKNEGFIIASDVSFVTKGADIRAVADEECNAPIDRSGVWAVLRNALSFDYLWNEVRVKGGAYGVGFRHSLQGMGRFQSFRDPHIDRTLASYDGAADWVAGFDPAPEEMEGYIVSTVAQHDAPEKPRAIAARQDLAYFQGRPADYRETMRASELACTPEVMRACAPAFAKIADEGAVCVFGNREALQQAKTPLTLIDLTGGQG